MSDTLTCIRFGIRSQRTSLPKALKKLNDLHNRWKGKIYELYREPWLKSTKGLLGVPGISGSKPWNWVSPVGFRRNVFPEEDGFKCEGHYMDKLGAPFQIFSVASASDQAHQTDYIVNKPETSASPKTVCSWWERGQSWAFQAAQSSGCPVPSVQAFQAPPRTRPKFQHLCERSKILQPVSRMLILGIHNAVVAVPADVTSLGCHCPCSMLLTVFFDIFHMMMTKVWYCHGHDLCPASRALLRCPAIVWLVWIAGFLVGTAANTDGGVCLLPMTEFLQNNWPTSFYQIVPGFWLQRIFWSQFRAHRQKRKNVS